MAHEIPAATINNLSKIFVQYTANTLPVCAFSTYSQDIPNSTLDKLQTVLRNDGVTGATTNVSVLPCYGLAYNSNGYISYTLSTTATK